MHPSPPLPETMTAWLESLPEPHILFDRHYRILAANAAYLRQYGQGRPVLGRTCHEVSHHSSVPCDQAGESCPLARALQSRQRERVLHLHHTRSGEDYVQIELLPLRGPGGQLQYFLEKMEPLPISSGCGAAGGAQGMIGRSPAFQAVRELIARVGPSQASVLLLGESGTGKELAARAVHEASTRAARALVVVDCASLPETLFESELFGHEKGAFTGAHAARAGLVEAAHGGTLFLDEVAELPMHMQVKLLRVLQEKAVRPIGARAEVGVDVRILSATHKNLARLVELGSFRQDLFYRINVIELKVAPLRNRREDIPQLAARVLERLAKDSGLPPAQLPPEALQALVNYDFPGNVRELENVLERAVALCENNVIDISDLRLSNSPERSAPIEPVVYHTPPPPPAAHVHAPAPMAAPPREAPHFAVPEPPEDAGFPNDLAAAVAETERAAIMKALEATRWNRTAAARNLGLTLRQLRYRLEKLGIE